MSFSMLRLLFVEFWLGVRRGGSSVRATRGALFCFGVFGFEDGEVNDEGDDDNEDKEDGGDYA